MWRPRFAFSSLFFFFLLLHMNSNITWFSYVGDKNTVHALFMYCFRTVHGSHDTIHTFKNYFATMFLVFSFQFSVSAIINSIQTNPKSSQIQCLLFNNCPEKLLTEWTININECFQNGSTIAISAENQTSRQSQHSDTSFL